MPCTRNWIKHAIATIEADYTRSADTHLLPLPLPGLPGIHLYLKDESTHPTGSLKHRLARSLFLYGLCNGWIREDTTIVEASSGSTAVSEAYFARLIGLPFIAVMPTGTSIEKIALIQRYGGHCRLVDAPAKLYDMSREIAAECGGHFMDQFTYAERATDWRGNNNIAESIYAQMAREPHPQPQWIVCSAGTGGTSSTLGRYVRYCSHDTRVCVVDPDSSVFFDYFRTRDPGLTCAGGSVVEGIGRPRVEPSFNADVIDRMIKVPDAATFAAVHFLEETLGRRCGGSTGTNFYGALLLAAEMHARKQQGSLVTLICDPGDRYANSYFDHEWLASHGYDISTHLDRIRSTFETGLWGDEVPSVSV